MHKFFVCTWISCNPQEPVLAETVRKIRNTPGWAVWATVRIASLAFAVQNFWSPVEQGIILAYTTFVLLPLGFQSVWVFRTQRGKQTFCPFKCFEIFLCFETSFGGGRFHQWRWTFFSLTSIPVFSVYGHSCCFPVRTVASAK